MANLLEAYSKRIRVAEQVYSKSHEGQSMDNNRKLAVAQCLRNVDKYLTEAFDNSMGTQRADMGFKFQKQSVNMATY